MPDSDPLSTQLTSNLVRIEQRIAAACQRSGRSRDAVQLVAVTKSVPLSTVRTLVHCGPSRLGENRPQQLVERAQALAAHPDDFGTAQHVPEWHLIGQLQRNKIRSVLPWIAMIHSVESLPQLRQIDRIAGELGLTPKVLLQVNISGEESKSGFQPQAARNLWNELQQVEHTRLAGLMTMAPFTEDETVIRRTFRGLRELRDELQHQATQPALMELSMGMSHDFEIAIEEGATLIRIGSLLFEECRRQGTF